MKLLKSMKSTGSFFSLPSALLFPVLSVLSVVICLALPAAAAKPEETAAEAKATATTKTADPVPASDEPAELDYHVLQSDPRWADLEMGWLSVADSACGPATLCNALYYLNGFRADLVEVCRWALDAGLYNPPGVGGVYRSVFRKAAGVYGRRFGFSATDYRSGSVRSEELLRHLQSGGTAALHVTGHFMAAAGIDEKTGRILVLDPLPGDVGRYDRRRKGITHTGGDWLTPETLSKGVTAVDGYVLLSRAVTQNESDAVLKASLAGLTISN